MLFLCFYIAVAWVGVVAQVVVHRATDGEVLSSIPMGGLFSSLLFPIFQSVVRPYTCPSYRSNNTNFRLSNKNKGFIVQLEAKYTRNEQKISQCRVLNQKEVQHYKIMQMCIFIAHNSDLFSSEHNQLIGLSPS